ncbi:hypothetical protein THRCLA_00094 [Thraustotheca clavata]|uniref:DUF218 domain-containing protein n=1 Tax=Thraustotheca clavata TaxID=74557 RepID=A0A1W0ACG5_9STRA|nr:hypothetical protein THRCLA_00094 [Thraustotheca clavata]
MYTTIAGKAKKPGYTRRDSGRLPEPKRSEEQNKLLASVGLDLFRSGMQIDGAGTKPLHVEARHPAIEPNLHSIPEEKQVQSSFVQEAQVIVLLGAPLGPKSTPGFLLSQRIDVLLPLYSSIIQQDTVCYVVLFGGDGSEQGTIENEVMRNLLIQRGVSQYHIIMDCTGASSLQNILTLIPILRHLQLKIIRVVTSAYQMPRMHLYFDSILHRCRNMSLEIYYHPTRDQLSFHQQKQLEAKEENLTANTRQQLQDAMYTAEKMSLPTQSILPPAPANNRRGSNTSTTSFYGCMSNCVMFERYKGVFSTLSTPFKFFLMSRLGRYEKSSDADSIERLSSKLTADLRNHVRFMADYPILSDEWKEMAKNMTRFGEISEMERKLPKQENATLWECEELALRYILEDGKLNLCLRILVEYKEYERNTAIRDFDPDTKKLMASFERGLGVMLKNAWLHVEALQTTDLPLLIEYVATILNNCREEPGFFSEKDPADSQEVIVLYYLHGLLKRLEDIGESRIMPLMQERQIFELVAWHLEHNNRSFSPEDTLTAAEVLALICDTEDFQTHPTNYVSSNQARQNLAAIQGTVD